VNPLRPEHSQGERAEGQVAVAPINDGDVEILTPILVSTTNLVSVAHAARGLDWSRDYIDAVLTAIPAALDGTGLRLHHFKGRARITWVNSTRKPVARTIGRLQTMTRGLTSVQAHTLRRITDSEPIAQRNIAKGEKSPWVPSRT
jgi:chromosome segregation and condensation protein ScpB